MRFKVLDGWRGICALLVAIFHFSAFSHFKEISFFNNAYLFVDFFFVLSGFVICHAYYDRITDSGGAVQFIVRRFGRLWPLHIFTLGILIVLLLGGLLAAKFLNISFGSDAFSPPNWTLWAIPTNIFLIQSLHLHDGLNWNKPSWSISCEMWAYVVFMLVCLVAPKRKIIAGLLIAVLSALLLPFLSQSGIATSFQFGFLRCLYGFFTGVIVYRLWLSYRLGGKTSFNLIEGATILLVGVFVSLVGMGPFSFFAPLVFGFAVFVFASEGGDVSSIFDNRICNHLGKISYSIYMVHVPLITIMVNFSKVIERVTGKDILISVNNDEGRGIQYFNFGNKWSMDLMVMAYVLGVIILATFTFHLVEDPGRKYFNKVADRLKRTRRVAEEIKPA